MKTIETIKSELFDHFAGGTLSNEYYTNEEVCEIVKQANKDWENAEPEDADSVLEDASKEIRYVLYGTCVDPLNEDGIDKFRLLQEYGINIDELRENGDLERMLNYGRSSLLTAYPVIAGVCFPMHVKLSLRKRSDNSLAVIPHPIRKAPNFEEYRGYRFTDEDVNNLITTGNLGHTITIDSRLLGMQSEIYLSLDRDTNEMVALAKNYVHIPNKIKGAYLTNEQKKMLKDGAKVHIKGLVNDDDVFFDADVQINAEKRGFAFSNVKVC